MHGLGCAICTNSIIKQYSLWHALSHILIRPSALQQTFGLSSMLRCIGLLWERFADEWIERRKAKGNNQCTRFVSLLSRFRWCFPPTPKILIRSSLNGSIDDYLKMSNTFHFHMWHIPSDPIEFSVDLWLTSKNKCVAQRPSNYVRKTMIVHFQSHFQYHFHTPLSADIQRKQPEMCIRTRNSKNILKINQKKNRFNSRDGETHVA